MAQSRQGARRDAAQAGLNSRSLCWPVGVALCALGDGPYSRVSFTFSVTKNSMTSPGFTSL
jgi:hypothetical protein